MGNALTRRDSLAHYPVRPPGEAFVAAMPEGASMFTMWVVMVNSSILVVVAIIDGPATVSSERVFQEAGCLSRSRNPFLTEAAGPVVLAFPLS